MTPSLIAVTGAGGFIGAHACRHLSTQGFRIRRLLGPRDSNQIGGGDLGYDARFDIIDVALLSELFSGVNTVVHVAGPPSVRSSFDEPAQFARTHVEGTAAVLEAARKSDVKRIVYISSAEVYGRRADERLKEEHPLEARSPYGAAKIGAEQMVRAFSHAYGLDALILRPFSVYGPGMSVHSLVWRVVSQLNESGPLRVADLRPVRDYCFVGDVARAIERAIVAPTRGVEAINIGSGIGTSVAELAATALALVDNPRLVCEDLAERRPGNSEILSLVADTCKAERLLDWVPQVTLASGLREMTAVVTQT
jgi:nucleoside-diphosphate-sugar epimerase